MSSYLGMLANGTTVSILLHNSNGAVVSSHMQLVIVSRSLPRTVVTHAGSFYKRSQTLMLRVAP